MKLFREKFVIKLTQLDLMEEMSIQEYIESEKTKANETKYISKKQKKLKKKRVRWEGKANTAGRQRKNAGQLDLERSSK